MSFASPAEVPRRGRLTILDQCRCPSPSCVRRYYVLVRVRVAAITYAGQDIPCRLVPAVPEEDEPAPAYYSYCFSVSPPAYFQQPQQRRMTITNAASHSTSSITRTCNLCITICNQPPRTLTRYYTQLQIILFASPQPNIRFGSTPGSHFHDGSSCMYSSRYIRVSLLASIHTALSRCRAT